MGADVRILDEHGLALAGGRQVPFNTGNGGLLGAGVHVGVAIVNVGVVRVKEDLESDGGVLAREGVFVPDGIHEDFVPLDDEEAAIGSFSTNAIHVLGKDTAVLFILGGTVLIFTKIQSSKFDHECVIVKLK